MKLHISHGAALDWFIVEPLEDQTEISLAGTPITHEMAVASLLKAGRTVYEIDNAVPMARTGHVTLLGAVIPLGGSGEG